MPEVYACRLCTNICTDSMGLCDSTGQYTEVYKMTINFFHPKFLDLESSTRNDYAVLCLECWNHISEFYYFQQTVILAQSKLLENAEQQTKGLVASPDEIQPQLSNINSIDVDAVKEEEDEVVCLPDVELIKYTITECPEDNIIKEEIDNDASVLSNNISVGNSSEDDEIVSLSDDEEFEEPFGYFTGEDFTNEGENMNLLSPIDQQDSSSNGNTRRAAKPVNKTYKRRKIMEMDEIIAQWKPSLECVICKESYRTLTLLREHFRKDHPKEECYIVCCGRQFKYRCRIREHIRIHLNPNAFKCEICEKCFSTKSILDYHMYSKHLHTKNDLNTQDVAPNLTCHICGKAYKMQSALSHHLSTHTAESIYSCSHCQEIFHHLTSLRDHINEMHPEKQKCSFCPKTFSHRSGLYIHIKERHPEEFAKKPKRVRRKPFK